jgi:IMP dehydrogenase
VHETIIGGAKRATVGYGLDEISLVPTKRTRSPELIDVSWKLDAYQFQLPVIGAPLDPVTSPDTAAILADLGSFGVLNLEGLWTRYDDPTEILAEIARLEGGSEATEQLRRF